MKINRSKILLLSLALLLAIFLLCPPARAGWKNDGKVVNRKIIGKKDGINVIKITYMSDNLKVKGLMFLPSVQNKLPCVIFCHDGISGISKEHRLSSIRLARAGYAVFSPSYRGEDGSEGQIEIAKGEVRDVLNAIEMVSSIKQIDKDRVALAGASHGALICVLAASRTDKIKSLVSAYGVMNIYKWWEYLKKHDKIGKDKITKQTYGKGPEDRPVSFFIRNAVAYAKSIKCPTLILQGQKDDIVPPDQAKYMKEILDKHKIPNVMKIYPDCLHGFLIYVPYLKDGIEKKEREQTEEAWQTFLDFLEQNIGKSSLPSQKE